MVTALTPFNFGTSNGYVIIWFEMFLRLCNAKESAILIYAVSTYARFVTRKMI